MKFWKSIFATSMLLGILFVPINIILQVNAQEGQVVIDPSDDTYTDSDNPNSNYGGQHNLVVSKYEYVGITEEIVWLKFNLSIVDDGAVVDVATLQLWAGYLSETYNVYAHSCSDNSWTELALTYSNMPTFNATSMDSTVVSTSFEYYNWNVIDAVRRGVDGIHGGPDVVTIVLLETSLRGTFSSVPLSSKEQLINAPELTVHWSAIIPEFPSYLILPLFMIATLLAVIVYRRRDHSK